MSNYSYIKRTSAVKEWLRYHLLEKKLNSFPGILLLALIAVILGYLTKEIDYRAGFGLVVAFAFFLLMVACLRLPYFGIYFLIVFSALPPFLGRVFMDSSLKIEYGHLIDIMTPLLFFSVLIKPQPDKGNGKSFFGNPITTSFIILWVYYFIEAMNPSMGSFLGWISFMRGNLLLFLSFYVLFRLLNSWKTIRYFIFFNIAFTTVLAMYACKQQWFGLTNFELKWATADPIGFQMLFQGGFLRKWSTLSDPATAGILFASVSVQCIILALRLQGKKTKILLGIALLFNLMGYGYSGTRTATLMVIAGIAFYIVATINEKRTLFFLVVALLSFAVILWGPFSPPPITRIRTTFQGNKDLSAAARELNRHRIQPYLYQHPIGGGVFTCGSEGPKYNPGHYLVNFQPDSGYMKTLAEQGMIGLALLLISYFMIMKYGLHNFYRARNPELVSHGIAILAMIFSLMAGQYSQIAIGPYPQILSYLGCLVFLIKLPDLDNEKINS